MGSRFLVAVLEFLLAASGLALHLPELSTEGLSPLAKCAVQRNAAIAAYRSLADSWLHDNIALSPVDAIATLSGMYAYYDEVELSGFFDSFEVDPDRSSATEKYLEILQAFINQRNIGLSFDIISAHRYGCSEFDYNATLPANGFVDGDNEIIFSSIEKAFPFLESWYRDIHIDVKFDKAEFGQQTCDVSAGGSSFRHVWQNYERCAFRSKFYSTDGTVVDDVKYTRTSHRGPYGELPELNAKYIKVDWNGYKRFDQFYHLYIILPDALDGLHQLETRITESAIRRMMQESVYRPMVDVILPEISVTRKYHLLPITKKVTEEVNPHQTYDVVTAAKFDAFRASAINCSSSQGHESAKSSNDLFFNADHPFLMLVIYNGDGVDYSMIVGMLGYRTVEQAQYQP